jgi:molecular chaperone IbpA
MRTYNLNTLFPYSVGFDRFDKLFDMAARAAARDGSYPPYNIIKAGEDQYRITMAVAGFTEDDLEIVFQDNVLVVRGKAKEAQDEGVTYLHRGIATRAFEHSFQLADHVKVSGARLANGLLDIELVREVPEAMKPRRIAINHEVPQQQQIEGRVEGTTVEGQAEQREAA